MQKILHFQEILVLMHNHALELEFLGNAVWYKISSTTQRVVLESGS